MSVVHADFTIERQFDCAPAQTFSAFSDPELKGRWFAVPADWENRVWELFPAEAGTRLVFTEQGAFFDRRDDPAAREHGTGKLLDALGEQLAAAPAR